MTGSMIPYSFVPGTKAKASEVNANFLSLANVILQNQTTSSSSIQTIQGQISNISETLAQKADRTDIQSVFIVDDTNTNLDDYLTAGTYIFDSVHAPANPPVGSSGMLVVDGDSTAFLTQTWYDDTGNYSVQTRTYINSSWSSWMADSGIVSLTNPGYLKMSNGIIIQWGYATTTTNTYPIAFSQLACVLVTKTGSAGSFERSDSGIETQSLTGFSYTTYGYYSSINWIAIGY